MYQDVSLRYGVNQTRPAFPAFPAFELHSPRMRRCAPRILALAALLGAACHPCQDWTDLPVDDPGGLATADQLAAVRAGIDQFVAWTARDETCVEDVRFVDTLERNGVPVVGQYASNSHRISLKATLTDGMLPSVTSHELCHALDYEEGSISLDNAEVLAPHTEGLDPIVYDTEDRRTREAFANICEAGPALPALYEALSEACSVEVADPAVLFVEEVVFAPRDGAPELGTFSAAATWTTLEGTERAGTALGRSVVPGGGGVLVLDLVGAYDDAGVEFLVTPELLRIDPSSRAVVERLTLDSHAPTRLDGQPPYAIHTLLGSSGDPLLVSIVDGAAWRVRTDPLALVPVEFPAFDLGTVLIGFEHEGRALVKGTRDGARLVALVDLDDGTITPVAAGEADLFSADRPVALYADEQGGLAIFAGGPGAVLVSVDWTGEVQWLRALPSQDDRVRALTRLADGSILVAQTIYLLDGEMSVGVPLPFRLDPADGTWSAPDGDCAGWSEYSGWVLADGAPRGVWTERLGDAGYRLQWGELAVSAR